MTITNRCDFSANIRRGFIAFLSLFACACSSPDAGERAPHQTQTVAGATEVARTAPELELGAISAFDVDSRGRMYVGERDRIAVLSDDGRLIRRFGREGGGPGEFQYVGNVVALTRDSLFVYDAGLQRISVFPPDSDKPAFTTNLFGSMVTVPSWAARVDGKGHVLASYQTAMGDVPGREGGRSVPEVLRLLNQDGSIAHDSVVLMRERQTLGIDNAEGRGFLQFPYARHTVFTVSPNGIIYHAWTDSLRFTATDLSGRTLRSFGRAHRPRAVTRHEVDSVANSMVGMRFSPQTVRTALARTGLTTWPAIRTFIADDQDRLWVMLTPERDDAEPEWTVFSGTGQELGTVHFPGAAGLLAVRGDQAYGVALDENDVPSIVRYRLEAAPPNAGRSP